MKIAIDLSPLQSPHRMRGIGYTLINFVNNIPSTERQQHSFIFFVSASPNNHFKGDPLELLDLKGMNYTVRPIDSGSNAPSTPKPKRLERHRQRVNHLLPGRLQGLVTRLGRGSTELRSYYSGDSRVQDLSDIDIYLQADQSQCVPSKRGMKTALIIYDIIPFVLEWDYLWSYRTSRHHGQSRKRALVCKLRRWLYIHKIRLNTKSADYLLAISEHTKRDFMRFLSVPEEKIRVVPLGVSEIQTTKETPSLQHYVQNSWGHIKRPLKLTANDKFLLFVGGADRRRKLQDLVSAFNHLRAQGHDIKLVLAGDIMLGPDAITTPEIRSALKSSSYLNDIIFMGFIDDASRDWLYKNALAFVFPSKYEGFGLPVLEAMAYGCPVISYENAATREVAGDAPLYADDIYGIHDRTKELLIMNKESLISLQKKGKAQAAKYNWARTSADMINAMCDWSGQKETRI